jgi:hypothetical protein
VNTLGDLAQQSSGDLLVGGVLLEVDGNQQLLSLGIDIADINTTLVVEEDPVTLECAISSDHCNLFLLLLIVPSSTAPNLERVDSLPREQN